MSQLRDASFLLQCKDTEKNIMVVNECNVIACSANGIKQEEESAAASPRTICDSFWSSVVNIFKEDTDRWGRFS